MGSTAIANGNVVRKQSLRPNKRPLMSRWNFLIFFLIQILIKSRIWVKSGNGVPFQMRKKWRRVKYDDGRDVDEHDGKLRNSLAC